MSETLDNIFASYVNQGTLEEAAAWMASLTRSHPELAEAFISALQQGIAAASKGDAAVVKSVNAGGRRVATAAEAGEHCLKLLGFYSQQLRE
jgi:ABC-type nitrate/sulfonate/bicarbonate transport system substrate-binding protein